MQCHEFETRVHELLDERLPPADDAALAAHAAECPACRAALSDMSSLLDAVAARPRPVGRSDLAARVLADMHVCPAAQSPPRWSVARWAALATAACLLIATTIAIWNWIDQRPIATEAPLPAPPVVASGVAHGAAPETDLSDSLADAWLLAPGVEATEPYDAAAQQSPQPTGWGPELAAGLRPLADSTTDAWDFLMTTLPAPSDAAVEPIRTAPASADAPAVQDET